jgi:hypothetical protein
VAAPYKPAVHVLAAQLPASNPDVDGEEGGVRLANGLGTL